jgi:hypothetical protein
MPEGVQVYSLHAGIKMAWEHGGADFQSRFDKSTAQAEEMKEGRYAFCETPSMLHLL